MSDSQVTLGPRGQKLSTGLKWALILGAAYAVSHIVLSIIVGIVGIAIAVAVYALVVAMVPLVSLKISTFVMKRFIAEVRANPVEARMKVFAAKQDLLEAAKQQLGEFNRAVNDYAREVEDLVRNYPEEAAKYRAHQDAMVKMLNLRYSGWEKARQALVEYDKMTDKVRAIWKATLASDKMSKAASALGVKDAWSKIINDESIRVAEEGISNSFADLDHALRMESIEDAQSKPGVAALANNPSPSLLTKNADGSFQLPSLSIPSARVAVPA